MAPSSAPSGPRTRIIEFNHLPRATRERFIACLNGRGTPAPILRTSSTTGAIVGWVFLLLGSGAGLLWVTVAGYGSVWSCWQNPGWLLLYGALFLGLGWSIIGLVRRVILSGALPYPPGVYVFPMEMVVAQNRDLKIVPMSELASLQPVHHYRNGFYTHTMFHFVFVDGTRQSFSIGGKDRAEMTLGYLRRAQGMLADAIAQGDLHAVASLDPFMEARMAGWENVGEFQAQAGGPVARSTPPILDKGWAFGLSAAVLLSAPLWYVRNVLSDEKAFAEAKASSETFELEEYGWNGHRHVDEVQKTLLPRAELKDAKDKHTVSDIQKFIDEHKDIDPAVVTEAQQALKDAIHAEFQKAKDSGTVSALRGFLKSYPKADDAALATTQIHSLYQQTLTDFRPRAAKGDPLMVPFVEQLIAYEEANESPPLEVRFRRHNSPSLALADKVLAKGADDDPMAKLGSALGTGGVAAVSDHFDDSDEDKRETVMVKSLQNGFGQVFPADVLPLKEGEALPENAKDVGTLDKPTILVDYTVGWSGETYTGEKSGRSFVGIKISFDVAMVLSGAPTAKNALKFKLNVEPPSEFTVSYETFSDPAYGSALDTAGPGDTQVYDVMALRAFDQLSTKMQRVFFEAPPKRQMPPKTQQDDDDSP